jgi:hypothetical protein
MIYNDNRTMKKYESFGTDEPYFYYKIQRS